MENVASGLSMWFYLGVVALIVGIIIIARSSKTNNKKAMENGYFILILGLVGVLSEWTNFAAVLLVLVIISGLIWIFDKLWLSKRRINYSTQDDSNIDVPHYVYYAKEFFPVVFVVFILRAFLFEAYQIPSSSMRPDLIVGDFILVNKFNYGIREPFSNKVIIGTHHPKRGEVMVFKDQTVKNRDLIKRVIGIPGDVIEYYNKRLIINGIPLQYEATGSYEYEEPIKDQEKFLIHNDKYVENLFGVKHYILTWDQMPTLFSAQVSDFPFKSNCEYKGDNGFKCIVPPNHYFMMGDNRDNSADSRYWGFVPDSDIIGRAMYVWLNFHDLKRFGIKI